LFVLGGAGFYPLVVIGIRVSFILDCLLLSVLDIHFIDRPVDNVDILMLYLQYILVIVYDELPVLLRRTGN